jgi:hypothetical protein
MLDIECDKKIPCVLNYSQIELAVFGREGTQLLQIFCRQV